MLRRLAAALRPGARIPRGKRLQYEVDVATVAVLTSGKPAEDVLAMPLDAQKQLVQRDVEGQVAHMFRALEEASALAVRAATSAPEPDLRYVGASGAASSSSSSSSSSATETSFGARRGPESAFHVGLEAELQRENDLEAGSGRAGNGHVHGNGHGAGLGAGSSAGHGQMEAAAVRSAIDEQLDIVEGHLRASYGTVPEVAASQIAHPAAGQGVFARGRATQGTVVALYPGEVYVPYQVKRLVDDFHRARASGDPGPQRRFEAVFGTPERPNAHAMERFDGNVLVASEGSVASRPNYFAVGHKINHPPRGAAPNVVACPLDLTRGFMERMDAQGAAFRSYVPNRFHESPELMADWQWKMYLVERDVEVPTVAFVATRDIADGEELFLNYRYNPDVEIGSVPEWYHHVNVEEDRMRWTV